jgi:hypothetical protein
MGADGRGVVLLEFLAGARQPTGGHSPTTLFTLKRSASI